MSQLIQDNGQPVEALHQFGARHNIKIDEKADAHEFSTQAQQNWLRNTQYQFQIKGRQPDPADLDLLRQLNLLEEVNALAGQYDGYCVLGATHLAVSKRFAHTIQQFQGGALASQIYVLGGSRVLDEQRENPQAILGSTLLPVKPDWEPPQEMPRYELAMMRFVVDRTAFPPTWQFLLPQTPPEEIGLGTEGNVDEFVKLNPPVGRYIVVSGQPHMWRQTLTFQKRLPNFSFLPIGYQSPDYPLATYLDELARLLHEELAM